MMVMIPGSDVDTPGFLWKVLYIVSGMLLKVLSAQGNLKGSGLVSGVKAVLRLRGSALNWV